MILPPSELNLSSVEDTRAQQANDLIRPARFKDYSFVPFPSSKSPTSIATTSGGASTRHVHGQTSQKPAIAQRTAIGEAQPMTSMGQADPLLRIPVESLIISPVL